MHVGFGSIRALAASQHARGAVAVTAAATVGSVAYIRSYPKQTPEKDARLAKRGMPRPVMEAICGAVGEVAQVCVGYPAESVKVRCQAEGLSAAAVLKQLFAQGSGPAIGQLYSGFVTASVLSCIVGAVHYASFCMSKRAAMAAGSSGAAQHAAAAGSSSQHGGHGHSGGGGADADTTSANLVAATVGALATALVESPAELLRHMAQAGQPVEPLLAAVRKGPGPALGALYGGSFIPFLIESFPYDLTELGVYGACGDARERALARPPGSPLADFVRGVPEQAWDVAAGAAAGTAAVLISMPFDTIKTYMQTHAAEMAAKGAWGQVQTFVALGAAMVAKQGPGALFVGVVPRLLQQVPSTTLCWVAIERCRDLLEPHTAA